MDTKEEGVGFDWVREVRLSIGIDLFLYLGHSNSIWQSIRADCVRLLPGRKDGSLFDRQLEQGKENISGGRQSRRMSTYSLGSIASTSGCGEFRVLEIKPGKSRPPPLSSPQALNKEIRLGAVISITIDLEVLITIGGYTKVTLREVPQFLVNAFNIISRQGKYTEGIFRKEGNSGRINSINTYALFMGRQKIPPEFSVHDVCTLVKRFLRELKRPLIDSPAVCRNLFALAQKKTPISQAEFSSAFEVLQQSDKDKRKKLEPMSLPHVGTLGFIMRHLYNLSLHSVNHQMTPENFATVLACVIFNDDVAREKRRRENRRGSQEDLLAMKKEELSQKIAVLRMLIGNANWIGVPSNPYVTSQAGNGANGTGVGGQQHIDSSIAEKKLSSLELTKCRSSSCIPRLRQE
ncbi:hypothetical protein WR25_19234 [Diploscapter pachys]|uniref:Rho-GAP domain-containing protein n=1 Tax=Diploscapter pachys TaxID=2018661 RepID=A0A2A2LY52_9BILA|nr:hypothetical protein WR25_19234 [Diploscapter pachys]